MYQIYKISLNGAEYKFRHIEKRIVEILFDNCTSRLNIGELGGSADAIISAESIWAETGERFKDTVTILREVDSPKYPVNQGFRAFHIAWDSGGETDEGYIILSANND